MTVRIWLLLAAMLAGALLTAACGGSGDDDDGGTDGRATGVAGVPDGAPLINQDNLKFSPSKLTIALGEEVYFKNSETAVHTVTINGKNESGTMKKDDVFSWTPAKTGEYKITCDFHPQMRATITVQEAPAS
jgi:plastocyanin